MKKLMGLTFALVLAFPLLAAAEQATGKVKTIDTTAGAIVLEDGTRLWLEEGTLANVQPGDAVRASYETMGGKNKITSMDRLTGVRWNESGFGARNPNADVESD